MKFVQAAQNRYGAVFWGYSKHDYPQGGVNEYGLFWDGTAVPGSEFQPDKNKPDFTEHLFENALLTCKTVKEAVTFIKRYNWEALPYGNFMLVDKMGASAIIGVGKDRKVHFQLREKSYQAISNFNIFNPEAGDYPDRRYDIVNARLEADGSPSVANFRSILSATHQEFIVQTVYSVVCDLNNGLIYLYNFHNFEDAIVLDIEKELLKENRSVSIRSLSDDPLFSEFIYDRFSSKPVTDKMEKHIEEGRLEQAVELFEKVVTKKPSYFTYYRYSYNEEMLSGLATRLMENDKVKAAIRIAELITVHYPESAEGFKIMGDAHLQTDQTEKALEYYNKSLILDPENIEIKNMIDRLAKKK